MDSEVAVVVAVAVEMAAGAAEVEEMEAWWPWIPMRASG